MKVSIKGNLPEGYKIVNGKVVKTFKAGGATNNTLQPISRENANLEAEKNETALTDLDNDGSFELYNIGGKRHTEGGTPLNLPEQSFVFSDTRKMLLSTEELKELGITSKKKMTPAAASKKFPLNKYIEILNNENSDKIAIDTAEEMINKNKIKLSQISFMQESKKDFSDGLPLAAYPFLVSRGIDPQEFEAKIQEKNAAAQGQQGPPQGPPQQSQQQMAMGPQQGNLQQFTGPPQGPPQGGPGMPPPEVMEQMAMQQGQGGMPPMGKYGTELPQMMHGDEQKYAQFHDSSQEDYDNITSGYKYGGSLPKFQIKGAKTGEQIIKGTSEVIKVVKGLAKDAGWFKKLLSGTSAKATEFGLNPLKFSLTDNLLFQRHKTLPQSYFNVTSNGLPISSLNVTGDIAGPLSYEKGFKGVAGKLGLQNYEQALRAQLNLSGEAGTTGSLMTNKNNPYSKYFNVDAVEGTDNINLLELNKLGKTELKKTFGLSNKKKFGLSTENTGSTMNYHFPFITSIKNRFRSANQTIGDGSSGYSSKTFEGQKTLSDYSRFPLLAAAGITIAYWAGDDGLDEADQEKKLEAWLVEQAKYNIKEPGLTDEERVVKFKLRLDSIQNGQPTPALKSEFQDQLKDAYDDSTKMIQDGTFNIERYGGEQIKKYKGGGGTGTEGAVLCDAYGNAIDPRMAAAADPNNNYRGPGMKFGGGLPSYQTTGELTHPSPGPGTIPGNRWDPYIQDYRTNPLPPAIASRPRSFFGNVGTRFGNIFRSDEKDIDPTQVMYDPATGEKLPSSEQTLLNRGPQPGYRPGEKMAVGSYKYGGSPFKNNALRKFTDGGSSEDPFGQIANTEGQMTQEQQVLMQLQMSKQQIMQEFASMEEYIAANPNIKEDPEKALQIQYNIQMLQSKLADIDMQTQSIEKSQIQQSMQINPFETDHPTAQDHHPQQSNQQMMRYGGALRKFVEGGDVEAPPLSEEELEAIKLRSESWNTTSYDADGNPVYGYDPDNANINKSHSDAFAVMAQPEFDGIRRAWIEEYRRKEKIYSDVTYEGNYMVQGKTDAELFQMFNKVHNYLSKVNAAGDKFSGSGKADPATGFDPITMAKKHGYGEEAPTRDEIRIFQGMYSSFNNVKRTDQTGLLDNIQLSPIGDDHGVYQQKHAAMLKDLKENRPALWNEMGKPEVGSKRMFDGDNYVSDIDGILGHTTGGQFYSAVNPIETIITHDEGKADCDQKAIQEGTERCNKLGKAFSKVICDCISGPGKLEETKKPIYETFPQDDAAVSLKAEQLATTDLIQPTLQSTPDPMTVDPKYVDPRQALSSIEASGAAAIQSNPDQATAIMGKMQDLSEQVINKHENINTKLYNNSQNINVAALNQFTGNRSDRFKTYMDESAMARGNFNTEYREGQDNLLAASNTQMDNADEMYIRNLENPNYWYSPQAHNIEYYNEKTIDGKQYADTGVTDWNQLYEDCRHSMPGADEAALNACVKMRSGSNTTLANKNKRKSDNKPEPEVVRFGSEITRNKKRTAELARSKRQLRKWLSGY